MKIQELEFYKLQMIGYSDEKVAVWLDRVMGKSNYRIENDRFEGQRIVIWSFAATPFECTHLTRYLDKLGIAYTLTLDGEAV